jgi:hypothetical protein
MKNAAEIKRNKKISLNFVAVSLKCHKETVNLNQKIMNCSNDKEIDAITYET